MNYCEECGNKIKENYNYCANCGFKIKKNNLIDNNFSEKEILCDLIEKYIEIANTNDTTLDDYMSIISLIKMLQLQYKEYAGDLQEYIEMFRKNGILDEYQIYFQSTPKRIFIQNKFHSNPELAYNMLYGYFDGCTSRFMNYLILFGLCGKPITKKQRNIMAHIFEGNSSLFNKQTLYYTKLYLDNGIFINSYNLSFLEKNKYEQVEKYIMYKQLASAYMGEKQYNNAILAYEKSIKYVKKTNLNKNRCIDEINERIEYAKFKISYPYIRKELLELFNIDIKRFNILVKDIKDNIEYKKNGSYSEKIIEYIKTKLTEESTKN